ncbi:hypothetical protein RMR16_019395 [Agrobacterium sp. rho-13.3]|uniref:hypothetical protein n=1 Tax=Agrobacterium sp. rho-13.3 TaxID=3072980 RepID=UPI002A10655B|nr:hypothetical protein [Agrobacterium sp. rho-13.3]MDX8308483.1 hypothetical protein [Agrobacterium sp. rho-13.3]
MTKKAKEALPMTIKNRPKLDSIGSSYSKWTVRYKLPNETLELGDKIVSALNLHRTVDTLGRWKAHHLAEVVLAVRDASGSERAAAEAKLANLMYNFNRPSPGRFRYSEGYDLKKVAPILYEILGKD